MSLSNHYLDDVAFTKEILACKQAGKLSDEACKTFMLLADRLARKSSYVNYPQLVKEDMIGDAIYRFAYRYDSFSLYKPTIVGMLKDKKESRNLSRTIFYKFIDELVRTFEKKGIVNEAVIKHFGLTDEERKEFDKALFGLKDTVKIEGAYSFFTTMAENEFKKKLNDYYLDINYRDHYLPIDEVYREDDDADLKELFPEVFEQ